MPINANTVSNISILHPAMYALGFTVHGKFGGKMHKQYDNKHGMYIFRTYGTNVKVYKYYYPYFPGSTKQTAMNTYMATAVSNWQSFTQPEKHYYNMLKRPRHMSGYNRYLRYYLLSMVKFMV